jgi:phage FluMu gp28-like protein
MAATTGNLKPDIEYDFEDEVGPISEEKWAIKRRAIKQSIPDALNDNELPDILLKHQKELFASVSQYSLTATDKSRRVGATWGLGAKATLVAGAKESAGGMDVLYLGYNLDMAREFIDTCAMWARAFMPLASAPEEYLFVDQGSEGKEERSIQAFRIRFASGFEIVALSSAPRSLRGRQGLAILDEFAFHDDAEELLKAAMAFIIWGGKVVVISTHNGADNPFNKLLEDIRKGEYGSDANVVRVTFDEAVDNGLYERVCLKRGEEWSAEGEAKWRANIRKIYRHNAAEELDCIPNQGSGVYMTRSQIEACTVPPDSVVTLICPPRFELKEEAYRTSYVESWLEQNVKPLLDALDPNLQHAYGQDFARSGDVSCGVPIEIGRDLVRRAPFVLEMRNVPYEQQKQVTIYVMERLPRFMGGKFDSTGNGGYLGEAAIQRFGENLIERVSMSQSWYADNMPKMKSGIEEKRLLYPANDNLVSDLRMVVLVRGIPMVPQGVKAEGTDGLPRHGDFAVALCLANAASLGQVLTYDGFQTVPKGYARQTRVAANEHPEDMPQFGRGGRMGGTKGTFG